MFNLRGSGFFERVDDLDSQSRYVGYVPGCQDHAVLNGGGAASRLSSTGTGRMAVILPQVSATAASTGRMRSENRRVVCLNHLSSTSACSVSLRLRICSIPLLISPITMTLVKMFLSSSFSYHVATFRLYRLLLLLRADTTFVSKRNLKAPLPWEVPLFFQARHRPGALTPEAP